MTQPSTPEDVLANLVMQCALAIIAGQETVTISSQGARPAGFPRGELLSVGSNGMRNFAVNPVKVLAWIHQRKKQRGATP